MTNRLYMPTFLAILALASFATAQTFATLYNFTGGTDGRGPYAGLIRDQAGYLYGTTAYGGNSNCGDGDDCGVVFKIDTAGNETVIHRFVGPPSDGAILYTPLLLDSDGNLYGTTAGGGTGRRHPNGTVFKIDTAGNETLLYTFAGGREGGEPEQGLIMDKAGHLYGTTLYGGPSRGGIIFRLNRAGKKTILHAFAVDSSDGITPALGHLTMDKAGNLYGLTTMGGLNNCRGAGCGVLYKLSKNGTYTVLHMFAGGTTDGCNPSGSVAIDKAGNLYGATYACGTNDRGTIWKITSNGAETILHNFDGAADGALPYGGVTLDSKGNLYGVTSFWGPNLNGTLYRLNTKDKFTVLHSFDGTDGNSAYGEVLRAPDGALYGTTYGGGSSGNGTVWKYTP